MVEAKVKASDLEGALFIADVVDLETGEVLFEANEPVPADLAERLKGKRHTALEIFFPEWDLCGAVLSNTLAKDSTRNAKEALLEIYRRMRPGDPPTLDSARSLFYGMFFDAKRYDFSRVGRFKFNIKLDSDVRGRPEDADRQGLHPGHRVPAAPASRRRPRRRHRQPRQPPRARGGRAAREPVPHRPRAHGARDQGEDVGSPGHRLGDAARPDQLQAGDRGDQGVLRLVAALAVHGPDQPAVRGHAQAAPLGARAGRPVARASGLRGARRARVALRPHLPDRDAGRPEHRPHLVARDLRADQRVRLHREPVQEGRERPRAQPLQGGQGRRRQVQARPDRRRGRAGGGERPAQEGGQASASRSSTTPST